MKAFLIIVAIGLICFLVYYCWFSVRIKLQTVNFFTGSLGSGKTTIGTRTAIRLRRRSKLLKFLFGWIPVIGKRIIVRSVYSNYPILLKARKRYFKTATSILFKKEFLQAHDLPLRFLVLKIQNPDGTITEKQTKIRIGYTWKELDEMKIDYTGADVKRYQQWSYCLSPDHIVEVLRVEESPILVYDEVSVDFPSLREKSDPRLVLAFHFLRQKTGATLIFMDQSIDCDIAIRRRLNIVYNFSDFTKWFFVAFSVTVKRIFYMEDVVVNVNNINDFEDRFYFGFFGRKTFASRYMRYLYYANPDTERKTWNGMYITEENPGYMDIEAHKAMPLKSWKGDENPAKAKPKKTLKKVS